MPACAASATDKGGNKNGSLRVSFDWEPKLKFHGAEVTSDAGLRRAARETWTVRKTRCTAARRAARWACDPSSRQ